MLECVCACVCARARAHTHTHKIIKYDFFIEGARSVMVIVVGNGHGNTSSNPGWEWLHFTYPKYPWERYESNYFPSSYG